MAASTDRFTLAKQWFARKGWTPQPFQLEAWRAFGAGEQGLINVPTGAGKTFAALFGPLSELAQNPSAPGLKILYITPIKALATDVEKALSEPIQALVPWATIATRTGDTTAYRKRKLRDTLPTVLVTTPESLALMLSYDGAGGAFSGVRSIIVDEWHDLMVSKRGTLLALNLSYIRTLAPSTQTWGMTATIGNLQHGLLLLLPTRSRGKIITGNVKRRTYIRALLPSNPALLPWSGHLGLKLLPVLLDDLDLSVVNIIFTNTRFQAERWYHALQSCLEKPNLVGLHHGSIDMKARHEVEDRLKKGDVKVVVATSSLDLGVDFSPVERVYQIGSPKSVYRTMQRAGRSAHQPGADCTLRVVPTNVQELFEIAAIERAIDEGKIEDRETPDRPLDVLIQHVCNRSLGEGCTITDLKTEVRATAFYQDLPDDIFDWVISYLTTGGHALRAYDEYKKLVYDQGRYKVANQTLRQLMLMNIGTIAADATVQVKFQRGQRLGQVEERYIGRMRPGDMFYFAGRPLELIKLHQGTAYVKPGKPRSFESPRWFGGQLAVSETLAEALRRSLKDPKPHNGSERSAYERFFVAQNRHAIVPSFDELLIEEWQDREGTHVFMFPIEGQFVNHALALLTSYQLAQAVPLTFSTSINEFGFELLTSTKIDLEQALTPSLFEDIDWQTSLAAAVNMTELRKQHFREVARVAGLVWQNYPRLRKSAAQVRASSSLIFDVYQDLEPNHPLLSQTTQEVLRHEFEGSRLNAALGRLTKRKWRFIRVPKPSPLAINLIGERLASRLSSEKLEERIGKLVQYYQT